MSFPIERLAGWLGKTMAMQDVPETRQIRSELLETAKNPDSHRQTDAEIDKLVHRRRVGVVAGGTAAYVHAVGGTMAGGHEIVGHGYLGAKATLQGAEPQIQLDGVDNFQELLHAKTLEAKVTGLYRWLTGYDAHQDFRSGYSYPAHGATGPNALGQALGADGREAWLALSGTLPALTLNSLTVMAGVSLGDKHPAAAWGLVTFGLLSHLQDSAYSIQGALLTSEQIQTASNSGQDYARLAVHLSAILGIPPRAVAIMTAAAVTGFVPGLALALYLYRQSRQTNLVPDHLALAHWLAKSSSDPTIDRLFVRLISQYPGKAQMQQSARRLIELTHQSVARPGSVSAETLAQAQQEAFAQRTACNNYLIRRIPGRALAQSKREILAGWQKLQASSELRELTEKLLVGGMLASAAAPVVSTLGKTIVPALRGAGRALSVGGPVVAAASAVQSTHEMLRDLRSPDAQVPRRAKHLSIAQAATAVTGALVVTASLIVPSMAVAFAPAIIGTVALGIVLAYAKYRVIKHQLSLTDASRPA